MWKSQKHWLKRKLKMRQAASVQLGHRARQGISCETLRTYATAEAARGRYLTPDQSNNSSWRASGDRFPFTYLGNHRCTTAGVTTIATRWTLVSIPTALKARR